MTSGEVPVRVSVLGQVALLHADGHEEVLRGQQAELLALLAEAYPSPVTVDVVVDHLWEGSRPSSAGSGLRVVLSRLRTRFQRSTDQTVLVNQPRQYQLELPPDAVDHVRFTTLLSRVRTAMEDGRPADALDQAEKALALWRGEAFGPLGDQRRLVPLANRLDEQRHEARELRVEALLGVDRVAEAVAAATELTGDSPLRERSWELLMRALYRDGRQGDALRAFQRAQETMVDELGLEVGRRLRDLEAAILRQDPALDASPTPGPSMVEMQELLEALGPAPGQLRSWAGGFVGRAAASHGLLEALDRHRLVTVHGPPGAGKTRLAHEALRELAGPVVVVDVAAVAEGDLDAVLAALVGVGGDDLRRAVIDALSSTDTVLLFDNAESRLADVSDLAAALIASCPDLGVVLTTRQPTGQTEEWRLRIGGLDDDIAVDLLLDLAFGSRIPPDLDRDSLVRLVERVDRLPFGLELVAAQLRTRPPEALLAELEDPEAGAVPHRERLASALADSIDALQPDDRSLLTDLAVFRGPFRAAQVAEVFGLDSAYTQAGLNRLYDRSLLTVARPERPDGRFRMLRTVRTALVDRAGDSLAAAERAHARKFAADSMAWTQELEGRHEARAVAAATESVEEVRGAFGWALAEGEPAVAADLIVGFWEYGFTRLQFTTYDWPDRFLERFDPDELEQPDDLLATAALSHWVRGQYAEGRAAARQALRAAEDGGRVAPARALEARFNLEATDGNAHEALQALDTLLRWTADNDRGRHRSVALVSSVLGYSQVGMSEQARTVAAESLELAETSANPSTLAWATFGDGYSWVDDDPDRAIRQLTEAIRICGPVRNRWVRGMALGAYATALRRAQRPASSVALLSELLDLWHRGNLQGQLGLVARELAVAFHELGADNHARTAAELALGLGRAHPMRPRDEELFDKLIPLVVLTDDPDPRAATARRVRALREAANSVVSPN